MADIRIHFIGIRSQNSISKSGNELLDSQPRLLDDVMQGARGQWLVAVDRDTDGSNRRPVVKQNVVASANAVELEAKPQQRAHGLLSGYRRQSLRAHGQAAMVR